jgi:hypothetical protein
VPAIGAGTVPEELDMTLLWKSAAAALVTAVRTKTISAVEPAPQRMATRHGTSRSLCGLAGINGAMVAQ